MYRGRFAPSPSGPLHFGSLTAAVASYLESRQRRGEWQLRIDDIDPPREQTGATQSIIRSLRDHGFRWDGEVHYQSQHSSAYTRALAQLHKQQLTYHCRCSRKQLNSAGTSIYPGTCRLQNHSTQQSAVRFIASGVFAFEDEIQGPFEQTMQSDVGDFVVHRRDGLFSYQLANVVDDGLSGMTHVVRGADLLDNTPRQLALIKALGFAPPQYAHIPVALDSNGLKLGKQTRAAALDSTLALSNLLAAWRFLGQADFPVSELRECESIESFWRSAVQHWDITRIPQVPGCRLENHP